MAEKHASVTFSTANWQYFLQQLWNFVKNTQSGIVRFATDGSYYGIKSGGVIQTTDSGFSTGFGTNGDYIVIEPVNAYPGGGRWQITFRSDTFNSTSSAQGTVIASWLGGWTQAGDGFGTNVTSTISNWHHQTVTMTTSDVWYFSCSNSDTYSNANGSQSYTYIRCLLNRNLSSENTKFAGVYMGGYVPTEPDYDTKPCVLFYNINSGNAGTGGYWCSSSGNAGKMPGNYAHNTFGGSIPALINTVSNANTGYGVSRSGNWVGTPVLILDYNNSKTLGAWGRYTQMTGQLSRTDATADAAAEYLVVADQVIRWKPTA